MAQNINPVFVLKGDMSNDNGTGMNQLITAAAPDYTGIDADYSLVFTAGADGAYIKGIKFKAGGTNVATVARIFFNNGSTPGTATNNTFFAEVSLPATTAINTAATAEIYLPMEMAIPAGFRVYVGLATAVAAGWTANVVGGHF
jgi:hypothetical protein